MPDDPLYLLVIAALVAVAAVLVVGVLGLARGGSFNRRNGNRLMRWRLAAQAIAIVLVMTYIFLRGY